MSGSVCSNCCSIVVLFCWNRCAPLSFHFSVWGSCRIEAFGLFDREVIQCMNPFTCFETALVEWIKWIGEEIEARNQQPNESAEKIVKVKQDTNFLKIFSAHGNSSGVLEWCNLSNLSLAWCKSSPNFFTLASLHSFVCSFISFSVRQAFFREHRTVKQKMLRI